MSSGKSKGERDDDFSFLLLAKSRLAEAALENYYALMMVCRKARRPLTE